MISRKINETCFIYPQLILGKGGFGTVYKGNWKGEEVAVKELRKSNGQIENTYYQPEIDFSIRIQNIKQENIVQIHEIIYTDRFTCYIVMELCNTDLRKYLSQKGGKLEPNEALNITHEIAKALQALHENKIAHRDIKPDNVFIRYTPEGTNLYKLGDFGLGKDQDSLTTKVGTISYMAPDTLDLVNLKYSEKVDIWSLGIMLHELLTGVVLFSAGSTEAIRNQILAFETYRKLHQICLNRSNNYGSDPVSLSFRLIKSEAIINLLNEMLMKDPANRKAISEIIQVIEQAKKDLNNPSRITQNNGIPFQPYAQNLNNSMLPQQPNSNQVYGLQQGYPQIPVVTNLPQQYYPQQQPINVNNSIPQNGQSNQNVAQRNEGTQSVEEISGLLRDSEENNQKTELKLKNQIETSTKFQKENENLKTQNENFKTQNENFKTQIENFKTQFENMKTQIENLKAQNLKNSASNQTAQALQVEFTEFKLNKQKEDRQRDEQDKKYKEKLREYTLNENKQKFLVMLNKVEKK